MTRTMRLLAPVTMAAAVLAMSACGYALAGRGSFLPEYIRVVGVPAFENKTPEFDIDRVLTEAVRVEFAGRGRYTIQPDTNNVDAILTGTILSVKPVTTAFTTDSQAARLQVEVTASFEFRDLRENKVIWSNPSLIYREQYDVATSTASGGVAAFFGQDQNALKRLAQNFSRSVVSSILEVF
jgi:outer membrane lipopolysaccharide assembly protein LptE/RlpB